MQIKLTKEYMGYQISPLNSTQEPIFVQVDWDFPGIASAFGFSPCDCGDTDGTVDCAHHTASEMITAAREYLDEHSGEIAEDPGYFGD